MTEETESTHFPDLSPYTRHLGGGVWPNVLNVGWLDAAQPVEQAAPNPAFLEKLYAIVIGSPSFDAHVSVRRRPAACSVCGRQIVVTRGGEELYLGRSELWVPAEDPVRYFAAPSLIPHYVEEHRYAPPRAFLDAVMNVALDDRYNAQREYQVMSYWHMRLADAGLLDRLK